MSAGNCPGSSWNAPHWLKSWPVLAAAAMLPAALLPALEVARGGGGLWNDFATYWLAGKLVSAGATPYDIDALVRLGAQEGVVFEAGTGFSYPLPFAVAMVTLAALPFTLAASLFTAASIIVFGLAVAGWLRDGVTWRSGPGGTFLAALAIGAYPPVPGSVLFGQANLLVFAVLALGIRGALYGWGQRTLAGGGWIGLAGIVKLVPLALFVPLALARRTGAVLGLLGAAMGAMLAAWVVAPAALAGSEHLIALGSPDAFWSNQSLNGYASRLTLGNDRVVAALPQVDPAPLGTALLITLAIATLAGLLRARQAVGTTSGVALAIGLTLVAATAAAPKNSLWNHVPALIGAGLLLAPIHGSGALRPLERALTLAWYGLAVFGLWFDSLGMVQGLGPVGSVLSGAPLVGVLALWAALGSCLLRLDQGSGDSSAQCVDPLRGEERRGGTRHRERKTVRWPRVTRTRRVRKV